jgi:hypothetical protein
MDSFKKTTNTKKKSSSKVLKASAVVAAAPKKAPPPPAPVTAALKKKPAMTVSPEERFKMIEQAAYFRAEKHGFQVDAHANWLAAEAEVDAILAKKGKK